MIIWIGKHKSKTENGWLYKQRMSEWTRCTSGSFFFYFSQLGVEQNYQNLKYFEKYYNQTSQKKTMVTSTRLPSVVMFTSQPRSKNMRFNNFRQCMDITPSNPCLESETINVEFPVQNRSCIACVLTVLLNQNMTAWYEKFFDLISNFSFHNYSHGVYFIKKGSKVILVDGSF